MAYYGYEFYYDGTRATWWGYLQVALVNMGWELHDDISSTVKVYKSNGESGKEPYGYIYIDAGTSTYIQFCAYQYWDNVTHVGTRPRYTSDAAASTRLASGVFATTIPALIAGDKNTVVAISYAKYTGGVVGIVFGHLGNRGTTLLTNAHGTAGTAGTLTVSTASGLGYGGKLQIISEDGYCENLSIVSVPDSQTVIVNKLSRNYGTGSIIGAPASVFGITNGPSYHNWWWPVSAWGDSGTAGTNITLYYSTSPISNPALHNLFFNEQKYILTPLTINTTDAVGTIYGDFGSNFLYGILSAEQDVFIANNDGSFSSAGGGCGTATSCGTAALIDSSKSWGTNALSNRFCVFTGGSGTAASAIGKVKKITGNDATSFSVDGGGWGIYPPVSGSLYILADDVRRGLSNIFANSSYITITSTACPV